VRIRRLSALAVPALAVVLIAAMLRFVGGLPATRDGSVDAVAATLPEPATIERPLDYGDDILPILSNACFACHGPDAAARAADLRLDDREAALASGAIVPGDARASELVARIRSENPLHRMPPVGSNRELTSEQIELLAAWVAGGAEYGSHWAFVPPQASPVAAGTVSDAAASGRQTVDVLVEARLAAAGLEPSPPADPRTQLRRVFLDLTGLPPTPEQVRAFAADPSDAAYARWVDELLASPRFGERWAPWWLDAARYADSQGYEKDAARAMWPYRDWVIRALNDGMPFGRFATEQIAGDLLPDATFEQRLATAFHRNTMTNAEGGTDDEEFRTAAVIDRVNTTMTAFMGLTMACAQCHTHKYDPLLHTEYYGMYAFFNQSKDADRDDDRPTLTYVPDDAATRMAEIEAWIREREAAAAAVADGAGEEDAELAARRGELEAIRRSLPRVPVMVERPAEQARPTHVFERGSFLSPGVAVEPHTPEVLHAFPEDAPRTRLGLSRWLTDPANPLTARVQVNRVWAELFGQGLVTTVEDFGVQGDRPEHRELLDHLAVAFRDGDWSIKDLVRAIVTSRTYRQSSAVSAAVLEADPANRLLARSGRFRLGAETIRDQALAVAGLLNLEMYGPPVLPYLPDGGVRNPYDGTPTRASTGGDQYRRAVYTRWRRTGHYESLATFDAPSRETCVMQRDRSNTPLQALVTLNDPVYVEAAQAFARRLIAASDDVAERVAMAIERALGRPPTTPELEVLVALHREESAGFAGDPERAIAFATSVHGPLPASMDAVDAAAMTAVCNVILNLDEFLTRP
jgi:mono/diheme cytochrome c family protein